MSLNMLEVQENTSHNNLTQDKSTENGKSSTEIFEENGEKNENIEVNDEQLNAKHNCVPDVENDPNITNINTESLILTKETSDVGNNLKERIDAVPDINQQSVEVGSDNETEDLVNTFSNKRKSKKITLFHSDSESEAEITNNIESLEKTSDNENVELDTGRPKKLKRITLIDSDSEDEGKKNSKQDSIENDVMEYKSVDQNKINEEIQQNTENQKKILSNLCDSESSDENNEEHEDKEEEGISDTELEALQSNVIIPKSRKGKQKQKSENKEKKMTAKIALEQRKEILAESQRRIRESRVSLPYHKPKCRSLKEFLQNRPKLAAPLSAVSQGHSPSLSIKMSMKQLEVITQKMKEREKELEEFYKSESESEPEEEKANDNTETADLNEFSSVGNTEFNHTDNSNNELINNENNLVEKMDSGSMEKTIDGNAEMTEITEDKNLSQVLQEKKTEETCENSEEKNETVFTSNEVTHVEESEKNSDPSLDHEENIQLNKYENPDLEHELTEELSESKEKIVNKEQSESVSKNNKIILISDILVNPPNSDESKISNNLDVELMELASKVEKDKTDLHDSYEFNLDNIEDESELLLQIEEGSKKEKMTADELKKRRLEMLEKMGVAKPRLSVEPNQVIDLEKGIAMPDEISILRERFIRHNLKIEKHSHKKEISILSVADGQLHKETLALKMNDDEDEDMKPLEKPGVRLQKLRVELQQQMSLRRSDLWKEKLTKRNKDKSLFSENDNGEDNNDEKSECDTKDILDDEEEADFTDPEEEDEELEEDDCDMSEKKKQKSDFVDEEAEESEIEENELDENEDGDVENENDEEEKDYDVMNEEDEEADIEDNEETANIEESSPKKKILKRIIKAFEEDSDDENKGNEINQTFGTMSKNTKMDTSCTSENLLSSLEAPNFKTRKPIPSPEKLEDDFATPVTYMTGLKNLNTSGSRFMPPENSTDEENPLHSSKIDDTNEEYKTATERSQLDSQNEQVNQYDGDTNSLSTQDVVDICSGDFPSSSKCISSPEISTQQLREVFTGSMKSSSDFNTQDVDDICSGGFTGVSQTIQVQEKVVALDDRDEHLISQLIDEDELENFKKKFESPGINSNVNITKTNTFDELEEVVGTGGVIDSDDEETGLKLKNKKRKRLAFSDDEESLTNETIQEEAIDLHDDDDDLGSNVEYDSEENEIEDTEGNEVSGENKNKKFKASDFFEEEAELSESEWGSADEDERNLDDLEFEKGDEENFDQDKLRTDIEKFQMKQMLDEDNREVKMLQELLLEDGELHGSGRQRQFRWKNIDAGGNDNEEKKDDDDDVYLEEDESEEKWRKERHEREMLKLKKQSQDEDSLIIESQSLSFTHKSLKIKSQTTFSPQVTSVEVDSSPKIKQPFALLNKRGSFLSRGEKILQKIAETSKVSFTNKNTNRIVFHTIDKDTKKRKASTANLTQSTPVALKKLRLSGLSPDLNKDRSRTGKSLFEKILD